MFLFLISNIVGSTIQITTLPLPVLSTLQAAGLVFNTAFATLLLHEPFTRYSLIGTILVCGGAVLIGIFGAIGEPAHDLSQLLDLLGRAQFIIWMIATILIVAITIVVARSLAYLSIKVHDQHEFSKEHERLKSLSIPSHEAHPHTPSGSLRRKPTLPLNVPIPKSLRSSRLRMLRGLSYALISGILSAHSLLVAKAAVELIVRSLTPPRSNQFNRYQSWLALVALLVFALSQLYYLHRGLRLCSTSVLYPFVFCVYNIIAIIDGLVYFNQSSQLTPVHAGLIALGTIVLLAGVVCLSWRLDEIPPIAPVTGPATTDPEAALEPTIANGSALDHADSPTESPSESSPLLPRSRSRRRSTNASNRGSSRRPTLSLVPPLLAPMPAAPSPSTGHIWAELEDESSDDNEDGIQDYLASLPRTPASFHLHQPPSSKKRRAREDSSGSHGTTRSRVSFADLVEDGNDETGAPSKSRHKRFSSVPTLFSTPDDTENKSNPIEPIRPTSAEPSRYDAGRSPAPIQDSHNPPPNQDVDSEANNIEDSREAQHTGWTSAPKRWARWFYKDTSPTETSDVSNEGGSK